MDCSTPGSSVFTLSRSLLGFMSVESVESLMLSNHLILCRHIFLLPWVFLSIRVFSYESPLYIRWPKYWSFSFSNSPSKEYSGLPCKIPPPPRGPEASPRINPVDALRPPQRTAWAALVWGSEKEVGSGLDSWNSPFLQLQWRKQAKRYADVDPLTFFFQTSSM